MIVFGAVLSAVGGDVVAGLHVVIRIVVEVLLAEPALYILIVGVVVVRGVIADLNDCPN